MHEIHEMKKFLIKSFIFAAILALLFLPLGIGLDPYNIFHWRHIRNNGVEPNKSYVKMQNVVHNPEKFDSFFFGSSRAGFFDVAKMTDGTYYNMAYSEGLPAEHLKNLKEMKAKGIRIQNVLLSVDDISFFVDPAMHGDQLYRKQYPMTGKLDEKLGFYLAYLDPITLKESISVIREHVDSDPGYGERLLATGSENLEIVPEFNYELMIPAWPDYYAAREESLDDIAAIVDFCAENGINLRVFTNPVNAVTYQKDVENGYLDFLRKLAEVTPYWNFSGYNDLTMNMDLYYETSHFCPAVADSVLDCIYNGNCDETLLSQGCGVYVTEENVDEVIGLLEEQAAAVQ